MTHFSLAGRAVLVTGAGRGIGLALVERLIGRGVNWVIVVGRDPAPLDALAARYQAVVPIIEDLCSPDGAKLIAAQAREISPDLSVVINNAGTQLLTDLFAADADRHREALAAEIAVNFTATIQLSIELMPQLLAQPSAMLVNVTSGLALAPKQSSPVYCATKAGIRSFTKALRYQAQANAPHVRIVEALPPIVDTAMTAGRGRGKISADACAAEIVAGMEAGKDAIYVGKAKLLRAIFGLSHTAAERIMRDG
ncbi:SDR family oxidoreductase [Sphingomonas radiodurans]|uniref:SDR family oxidoreductase n=1 Tax=Sphingomonas radiodurans TaxID=2890321 RepID=UPI001E57A38B|nr:SDR family NAD(P)-dependent oxidoreductase [Sphingomonas radiodurans]WBH16797.1 SDR family NAD(P)-dependent oxidoreductase [Sphingomonas radiodurans]